MHLPDLQALLKSVQRLDSPFRRVTTIAISTDEMYRTSTGPAIITWLTTSGGVRAADKTAMITIA